MRRPGERSGGLRILHLDDSAQDAELVRARLGDAVSMDWAANEREFDGFLRAGDYDVILADYELPGFDAPAALRLTQAIRPGTPFICVSGVIGEEAAVELLKAGATDYVAKDRLERLPIKLKRAVEETELRSAHREAEGALRESETRYRRLHESMRDAFVLVDMSGRVLESNRSFQAMLGYDAEELSRLSYQDITPDRWHALEARIVAEQIVPRGDSEVYEKEYIRKDGTVFPVELRTFLLRNQAGDPTGMWAIVRDITERHRTDDALRVESAALNAAANAVVITDREGRIQWVNPAFEALTGYASVDVCGRTPGELVKSGKHDREFYVRLWDTILAGEVWRGDIINRRKDGSLYTEEMTITPVRNATGEIGHFVAIKLDVTERRQLEEQVRASQKLEGIGRLAGGVAHDFNNLLGIILGHGEIAQPLLPPEHPVRVRLEQILEAARRAADLTRQLLAFSRRQVLQPQLIEINAMVADAQRLLGRLIGEDVELVVQLSPDPGLVRVDPNQMSQVLFNLGVNARDAMPGGGTLTLETAKVQLDADYARAHPPLAPGAYVQLRVSDSGVGMDEHVRQRVFEPFFTTKPEGTGSGLGLATVYGIVKQSGGFIWVETTLGRGTTFTIHLPLRTGVADLPSEAPLPDAEAQAGTETVLVVEDQDGLRDLVGELLANAGYRVLSARDGPEALTLADSHRATIHLLLTDVVMPRMSGKELADRLSVRRPEMRVLFVSGYTSNVIANYGLSGSRLRLLDKPFTRVSLLRSVRDALDGER